MAAPASPLGALQPDLYRSHEGPVYINAPDDNLAFGKLHFHLKYDSHLCDLTVHLIEGILLVFELMNRLHSKYNCVMLFCHIKLYMIVVCVCSTKSLPNR